MPYHLTGLRSWNINAEDYEAMVRHCQVNREAIQYLPRLRVIGQLMMHRHPI
jgi:hypothetical protein